MLDNVAVITANICYILRCRLVSVSFSKHSWVN